MTVQTTLKTLQWRVIKSRGTPTNLEKKNIEYAYSEINFLDGPNSHGKPYPNASKAEDRRIISV